MWLGIAAIMLIPILMIVLTLTLPYPAIRWTTIGVAALLAVFNGFGLPYPGVYDNFLIVETTGRTRAGKCSSRDPLQRIPDGQRVESETH
jgi:hypothetical protein